MTYYPYPINTGGSQAIPGRSRRCAFWISPFVQDAVLVDTAALGDEDRLHAGPDAFPENCLLVVVTPAHADRIRDAITAVPFPVGPVVFAAAIIDAWCRDDAALAARIGWR